jgi:transcription elongation factor GreA
VAEERVALTREGLAKLREELEYSKNVRRAEVAESLEQARESNLSTEAEPGYELAKEEQATLEKRILQLEDMVSRAELIDEKLAHNSDQVQLGSTVVVKPDDGPEQTIQIVGSLEVDVAKGKISDESPVGRALLGHRLGDTVEVTVPHGSRRLRIMSLT